MSNLDVSETDGIESGLRLKNYAQCGTRKLNKLLKLRDKQIAAAESGRPTSEKRISQLKYERETIVNTLLERAMTKNVQDS
jgi:hypothetical protein